ncbi:MAG: arginine--tRNA ligase [Oscillospiraceae bacterium]|nr:arginine--tRNA ligase [Oscillospiraceae bacterium]
MDYKLIFAEELEKNTSLSKADILNLIEVPPQEEMGDFAFPCFKFAKEMKKSPILIANDIKEKITSEFFEKAEANGPYINVFIKKEILIKNTIEEILSQKERYGNSELGKGKNIPMDFSSPNIARPFHVGHLSTTVLGAALYRIFKSQGYNPIAINHLGDWGTQFGKLIYAYNHWVDEDALNENPIKELLRIYIKYHKEAEDDPSLDNEARKHFKNLEDGNEHETMLWKKFTELSIIEFEKVYDRIGVKFDYYTGESFYYDKMDTTIKELDEKGLLTESQGAIVVNLEEYNMPPCIIKKADGATIYATRDLTAAEYRYNQFHFYKSLYVVALDQSLHFKQVFKVLELLGHEWAKDCIHVGFGLVKYAGRKFSTRQGEVVSLEELFNDSVKRANKIIEGKNPNLENKSEVAEKVGVGSIIFTFLKNNREKDIIIDWEEMLSPDGETGPYVQYTYARFNSILKKTDEVKQDVDYNLLSTNDEYQLVKTLSNFNKVLNEAIDRFEPFVITRYAIDVAKKFNKFYNSCPILTSEENLKNARLILAKAANQVLKNALGMIGVEVVPEM